MKKPAALTIAALLLVLGSSSAQESKRVPQGIREADKAEVAFEKGVPPPQIEARKAPQDLRRTADELSALAQSIPVDVGLVTNGILPKDVLTKLKRIEKLSKHLRQELAH